MKQLTLFLGLVCAVAAEAPYPASGWRPSGPAFDLPQKNSQKPQNNYLPPDPRTPEDTDVSVQGLPVDEQRPEFFLSPVSGQQYVGPDFNADIARLNERYQQELIEQQRIQEILRQQTTQTPGQIARTTPKPEEKTTTESDLNKGEVAPDDQKVTVEISKQKVQEYPAELLLTPLTQIRLVQQNGQLQEKPGFDAPIHLAAIQSILRQNRLVQNQQVEQNQQESFIVVPQKVDYQIQPVLLQPQLDYGVPDKSDAEDGEQNNEEYVPQGQIQFQVPQVQQQPKQFVNQQPQFVNQQQQFVNQQQQFVPQQPFQTQPQQFLTQPQQFVPQQQFVAQQQLQGQPQQFVPQQQQVFLSQQEQQFQPQQQQFQKQPQQQQSFLNQQQPYQPQSQQFQPQQQQQQQTFQPQPQYQPQQQTFQPQLQQIQPQLNQQDYQNQFLYPAQYQPVQDLGQFYQNQGVVPNGQGALQSGVTVDQQNGIEDKEETTEREDDSGSATAVATAFGDRTRPRVFSQYGAPVPERSTTEVPQQDEVPSTEDAPAIAVATAEARGRRKSAKLRNRRVRPVFTLDQSGHLVLSQDQ